MSGFRRRATLTGSPLSSTLARWTQPGFVKLVQRGTISIGAAATSATATITAVDVSNSIIHYLGNDYAAANTLASEYNSYVVLTNGTTVTATRSAQSGVSASVVSFEVIEYVPGVIKSVQAGTIALTGVATNTATVTTVNTLKATLMYLGFITNDGGGQGQFFKTRMTLTNATTITATKGNATENVTVSYMLVEFY